jgi:hypothetical protein
MAEASGARSWVVVIVLEAPQVGASRMVEASGVRSQGAKRVLKARRVGA